MITLAEEIISGRRLTKSDNLNLLLEANLSALSEGADRIRAALCGNRADLCSIVNGRGGRCSENCKFCAQSAHYSTDCNTYNFLPLHKVMEDFTRVVGNGVNRYSIVTSGRTMEGQDFEEALAAYRAMHKAYPKMILCASHGLMSAENLKRLKAAGVTMYHTNLETSQQYFPQVCTTHTYKDKLREIQLAKEAGLTVCSGGIFGMGEMWQDRIEMALELAKLEICSIPLNFLIPIKGTPFEDKERLGEEEIRRIVAIFRYINPTAYIRIAGGRNVFADGGKILFRSGANAVLTGDMLTTAGNNTAQDRQMITSLGYILEC